MLTTHVDDTQISTLSCSDCTDQGSDKRFNDTEGATHTFRVTLAAIITVRRPPLGCFHRLLTDVVPVVRSKDDICIHTSSTSGWKTSQTPPVVVGTAEFQSLRNASDTRSGVV